MQQDKAIVPKIPVYLRPNHRWKCEHGLLDLVWPTRSQIDRKAALPALAVGV